jgi:hypothetical protein
MCVCFVGFFMNLLFQQSLSR